MIPPKGVFVVGTDTGVGKTAVSVAIARRLTGQGVGVGVYKPVASGTTLADPLGDPRRLWAAAGGWAPVERVCPQVFAAACAPGDAARAEGRNVDVGLLRSGLDAWRMESDFLVVEGAGGLCSPLTDDLLVADLACDVGYPLVIVDDSRLGCIGRTIAAVMAARAFGLTVAAIVLSDVAAPAGLPGGMPGAADDPRSIAAAGAAFLSRRFAPLPVLRLPHGSADVAPATDWIAVATAREADRAAT